MDGEKKNKSGFLQQFYGFQVAENFGKKFTPFIVKNNLNYSKETNNKLTFVTITAFSSGHLHFF